MIFNPEKIKIHNEYSLFHYLHGRCHLFAMAYKEYNNDSEINALFGVFENEKYEEEIHIEHVFIKLKDNIYIDASGRKKTLEEIENEYSFNSLETFFGDEEDYNKWFKYNLEKKYIFDFEESEKDSLIKFFKKNKYFKKNKFKFNKKKY
tara:strand:+ start:32032 stop:32478 length:447 start_codon:yes stop_codon:yes gene_type:complete